MKESELKNEELEEKSLELEGLKEVKTWVNWIYVKNADGKTTKVPKAFDGTAVGTTQGYANKWCDYKTAKVQVDDGSAGGIGLIFNNITLDNGRTFAIAGIDIDHRNLEDPVVQDVISRMGTYAEKSPSGNGIHLLFLVDETKLPENFKDVFYIKNPQNKIEAYVASITNRFFTFTENIICDEPLNERTEQFLQFLNTYMRRNVDSSNNNEETASDTVQIENNLIPCSNQFILDTIAKVSGSDKFERLFYEGDTSDYNGDHSSADMGLASILAYYVGPNPDRIDNLMRQSMLYREKWERPDYRENTIKKAIAFCNGKFFDWQNEDVVDKENSYNGALETLNANEIMQLDLEPLTPIIHNLLYPGFGILAGAPKQGKSWSCLDMGISVSTGQPFLGFNTTKSDVLYLALEDSINRIQDRLGKILGLGNPAPEGFHIATTCHNLDEGLLTELQNTLNKNPKIKLIIVDTFQKVRGAQIRGETWYSSDYKEVAKLKRFADINKVCLLVIHHVRKENDSDPFNNISGSTGLTGRS